MSYVTCWSLKQWQQSGSGIVWPPRSVSPATTEVCALQDAMIQAERDWPLTQREYHQEEVNRGLHSARMAVRRRGVA